MARPFARQIERIPSSCSLGVANVVTCFLSSLDAFETEDFEIALRPLEAGEMEAQASVTSSDNTDYFPANNEVTETTEIMDANNCHTPIAGCNTFPNSSGGGGGGALYYLVLALLLTSLMKIRVKSPSKAEVS